MIKPFPSNVILKDNFFPQALNSREVIDYVKLQGSDNRDREEGFDYLIVTHEDFITAAETLAEWKTRKGFITEVVTTDMIGEEAVAIDQYVTFAFENYDPAPSYLLLFGDSEFVPTWYENEHASGGDQGYTAADLYFADVNDPPDLITDLSVGRIPIDTVEQAESVVARIIDYETEPTEDPVFYQWMTAACYFQDDNLDTYADRRFSKTSEDARNFLTENFYDVERIYYTHENVNPLHWNFGDYVFENDTPGAPIPEELHKPGFPWDGNSFDITNAVQRGTFFLLHRDHGFRQGWGDPYYTNSHVQSLTNTGKPPIVWTINCCTGWFDNETDQDVCGTPYTSESFTEMWFRNMNEGSMGLIGATRISYSGNNDRLAWGFMDAIWPEFLNWCGADYPDHYPIYEMGEVVSYGKEYMMTNYTWSDYRTTTLEEFNWFGDPSMKIWTMMPEDMTISHDPEIVVGSNSFVINCDVDDALVCLSSEGEVIGTAYTFGGSAMVEFEVLDFLAPMEITVTASNNLPYLAEIPIVAVGPFVVCETVEYIEIGDYNDGSLQSLDVLSMNITLDNLGIDSTSGDISAQLATESQFVNILVNSVQTDALAEGGSIILEDAFQIELLAGVIDYQELEFTVLMSSGEDDWESELILQCQGPEIEFSGFNVNVLTGEDQILDPGEDAEIWLNFSNTGNGFSYDLTSNLLSYDEYITVSGMDIIPVIEPGSEETTLTGFSASVSPDCPTDHNISMDLFAYDLIGSNLLENFEVSIGYIKEDFETGEDIWEHEPLDSLYLDEWHISTMRNYTADGGYSMKCGGWGTDPYSNGILAALYMPAIEVSSATSIKFHHWMQTNILPNNNTTDGGSIEISLNGGEFEQITPVDGYPAVTLGFPGLPFPESTSVFAGSIEWEEVHLDLTDYVGLIQIRFVFGSSPNFATGEGWYIDDVRIINEVTSSGNELIPSVSRLNQNYPNPFHPGGDRDPGTMISFQLAERGPISLEIYNLKGQKVNVLIDHEQFTEGMHTVSWNGRDNNNNDLPSGIYLYRLRGKELDSVKKMIMIR